VALFFALGTQQHAVAEVAGSVNDGVVLLPSPPWQQQHNYYLSMQINNKL
jgi:hypothetical protein